MNVGVPVAYEYDGWHDARWRYRAIEAPPCGERLLVPGHDIDLTCDMPKGHDQTGPHWKHRAILSHAGGHHVVWCDGACADPCHYVTAEVLPFLQRVRRSQP